MKNFLNRPPSRRFSRRPPARKLRLAGPEKSAAKPPPNFRLKAALPRDVTEKLAITVQSAYNHTIILQCCIEIGKSERIIYLELWGQSSSFSSSWFSAFLDRFVRPTAPFTMWAIDFYFELYVV